MAEIKVLNPEDAQADCLECPDYEEDGGCNYWGDCYRFALEIIEEKDQQN